MACPTANLPMASTMKTRPNAEAGRSLAIDDAHVGDGAVRWGSTGCVSGNSTATVAISWIAAIFAILRL